MIVKIVKLIIKKDKVEEFKMVFNYSKSKIVNFQGCIHVELLREFLEKNIFLSLFIGKVNSCLKNIEIQKFLILFGKKQNYILDQNQRHGV